jgi:glutathione S-transferase
MTHPFDEINAMGSRIDAGYCRPGGPMITLYYSAGACSMAPHVLLKQLSLPHTLVRIEPDKIREPSFLAVNPRAQVPVVRTPDGQLLTETVAILEWIAQQAPQARLVPEDPLDRARAIEVMSWLATRSHGHFGRWFRPERYAYRPEDVPRVRSEAGEAYASSLKHALDMLPDGPHALGERPSIVDAYLVVYFLWARYMQLDLAGLPRLASWAATHAGQPAVQQMLKAEGLA